MTLAVFGAGLAAIVLGGLGSLSARWFVRSLQLQAMGACGVAASGAVLLWSGGTLGSGFTSAVAPRFGLDGLSAFFLIVVGAVAAPSLVYASRYLQPSLTGRTVAALTAAFVVVMVVVLCARDPITFLAGWELMTLIPATLILVARSADRAARDSVFLYAAVTHLGGVGTWVAVLLLAHAGAMGDSSAIPTGSALQAVIAVAALVGMGTKAGVMPLHIWLPRAHPIAPAPVSALMSGAMIKIAIYGLVRVLVDWLGVLPAWIGGAVLALGALSAVGGVVYALFQHDLKRLLALHSIENIGIILLGLGACLLLRTRGDGEWAALALGAVLLHTLNHALFKGLLFLGAGSFERAVGALELERLGGLLRRMPWTGAGFLLGAAAIAGLPPLNGFASEWLTLQALLHVSAAGGVASGLAGAVALAALAATAALAVLCFVKVVGLVLLGPARTGAAAAAVDVARAMRGAVLLLAAACILLGVAPGLLYEQLVTLAPWPARAPAGLGLRLPGTGMLPTGSLALILVGLTVTLVVLRARSLTVVSPSWACGQELDPRLGWTSAGFTKPMRLILEAVLRPQREIEVVSRDGVLQSVAYRGHVPHLIEQHLYEPAGRLSLRAAARARRLQSGRLGTYVGYLIGLIVVLLSVARFGVFG